MSSEARQRPGLRRVLFAGGGTGGHVFMAVALAEELRRLQPETEVLFVGTRQGLEGRIVEPLGYRLETIRIGGLNRVGFARAFATVNRLPLTLLQSAQIVRRFVPSIVVGVGGYSSGPVVLATKLLRLPAILIEPNAFPGLTNRWLARWVDGAALAFEEAATSFRGKARITGIPIRREFHAVESTIRDTGPLRLLVFGGSQGSKSINTLVCDAIRELSSEQVAIVHQTGKADYDRVRGCYEQAGFPAEVTEFIDCMPEMFARSDLIISRSGASTVAELTAAGKASVLIPFPQAADDHQRKNAEALASRQAALVLEQEHTSGQELARVILRLSRNRDELRRMATASRALAQPDSVEKILELVQELARS